MAKNQHKQRKLPTLTFQQIEPNEPAGSVSQPVHPVEKRSKKFPEPFIERKESKKTNGEQFRLRMTKNQHKQRKLPKLTFQQTEPNELVGSVSQPVQTVEKRFKKFLESSLQIHESNKINGEQFQLQMTKDQCKQSKLPKLPFQQTQPNEPTDLVFQLVHPIERGSKNFKEP